jgi:hypothetical protein
MANLALTGQRTIRLLIQNSTPRGEANPRPGLGLLVPLLFVGHLVRRSTVYPVSPS